MIYDPRFELQVQRRAAKKYRTSDLQAGLKWGILTNTGRLQDL